ncbi:solute symporter family protein [Rickettsia amblyommatis str. Ac/Pa]|uniref:Solute symporter family protein n=2 Tax=Rickettsia amblyommatis TaxID=33989 RepID=A0A0F3N3A4_RICAM|nr:solute symporter family protein [Rickettsia amblyommatis str. Ac/Pa]
MTNLNIDNIIVIIFLIITLVIALRASRNIKDIAEYAIGNKVFGSGILTITILATYITGSKGIGYAGYVFDDGILPILSTILCGVIFCFSFIIFFILPRIKYFDGCLTTAELMGQIYGIKTRFTIGVLGSFYTITLVTLQIIWLGNVAELLGIPKLWGVIFGGTFLIIYSSIGGIKSITITDLIQFIAVTIMIPIIAYIVLNKVGGIKSLIAKMPIQHFDILHHPNLKDYLIYCVWYIFPAFPLSFPFIQRMLMARNNKQLINSYYISMFFLIIFFVLLTLTGLSATVLKETEDVNIPSKGSEVITYLINNYFFAGAKGILAIGLIGAVMSTADSFLNSGALLLAHDVIKPVCDKKNINIDELKLARYITFGLGVIAVFTASVNNVLPRIQYAGIVDLAKGINIASEIVALIFTIPLIAGIIGLKGNSLSFFVPTIITTVTFIIGKLFFDNELLIPISIAINLISFFTSHFILNKGFIMVKRDDCFVSNSPIKPSYSSKLFISLKSFSKQFINYSQLEIESYGVSANIFALFMIFNYMLPLFMYSYAEPNLYHWILLLRIIGGLMCIGLLLGPYWPSILKIYFPAYYHLTLCICLPFSTTFIFLLEKGNVEWFINITFAIMLLIVLVNWIVFTVLSITGTLLALTIYYSIFDGFMIPNTNVIYTLAYTCFFSVMIGIIFVRRRQQYVHRLFNHQQELRELYCSTTDQLIDALNYQEKLAHGLGKEGLEILKQAQKVTDNLRKQMIVDSSEVFTKAYNKLTSVTKYLEEVATQAKDYIRLEIKSIDINLLLNEVKAKISKLENAPILAFFNTANYKTIECDINLTTKLLINSIMQVQEYNLNNNYIQILIDSTELWYRIDSIKNYTKKIPAIRFVVTTLDKIDELPNFYMGDTTKAAFTLNSPKDLYKAESVKIINAHYGALHYIGFNNEYSIIFVIPLRVGDIRPKVMDLKENNSILQEIIVDSLDAKKIETKLIQDINKKNPNIDIKQIKKAINLIKKYHAKQTRKSGEHFYIHPLIVTDILLQFTSDEDALLSSLLHDIVEDTSMSLSTIEAIFNPTVAKLVNGVTKFEQGRKKLNLSQYENIQKLIEQEDTRVLMIKIADRIHNMRTITYHSSYEKQKKIAEQTLLFYIPIAKQLRLSQAVVELQNLVFEVLNKQQIAT